MGELAFPAPPLADAVVRLRPWREADVPAQLAAFGDPLFRRVSDWQPHSEPEARRRLAEQEAERRHGTGIWLAIVEPQEPGALLGGGSLNDVDRLVCRASVGYWLAPAARGRGAASHAVRLLAGWAFEALGLARLELTCGPDNERSQRVAERCGFVREGVLRSHLPFKGGRRDTLVFGLLPGELR